MSVHIPQVSRNNGELMLRSKLALAFAATLTLTSSGLHAQVVNDSVITRRVRVHLARQENLEGAVARQMLRGTLTRTTTDSITVLVHPEAAPVSINSNGIYQVDVSRGISPWRTALRRGIGGAIVWGALGSFGEEEFGGGPTENVLVWAGGGFLLGAVLGLAFPEEQWKRVFRR
jgi:hypothetical protein